MNNFLEKTKKMCSNFYVKWFSILFIAVCVGFCIVGPFLRYIDEEVTVETSASKKKLPIYCVGTDEKKLAISFDAAWGAEDTDTLLKVLKDNDVKATFFLCGYWVDKYPEEVKRIYEAGHTIGNHSNTHPHGNQLSLQKNKEEIMAVHQKVKDLLGFEMNLYRPPYSNRVY